MRIAKGSLGRAAALAVCAAMMATPAGAAELPITAKQLPIVLPLQQDVDGLDSTAPYGRWGRHHRRGGVDAGDVLAGVLIIGGIAAIASAASRSADERRARDGDPRYRDRDWRDRDRRDGEPDWKREPSWDYRDGNRSGSWGGGAGSEIDRAADRCANEVSREGRVEGIDEVARERDGWRVRGVLTGGRGFACSIAGDGGLRSVQVDSVGGGSGWGTAPAQRWESSDEWDMRGEDERGYNSAGAPGYAGQPGG